MRRMKVVVKKFGATLVIGMLLTVAALPNGRDTLFQGAKWNSSAQEVIATVGGSDSGNYLRGGLDVEDDGKISQEQSWLVNLWPPGMFYMYGIIFYIGGVEIPIIFVMLFLSITLWSVLLSWVYRFTKQQTNRTYAATSILGILVLCWPTHGLFTDQLLGSDGISFGIVLFAVLMFLKVDFTKHSKSAWKGLIAGFLIALAAYLRVSYEFVGHMISVMALIALLVFLVRRVKIFSFKRLQTNHIGLLCFLLTSAGAFQAATIPWRMIVAENVRPGNYSWSTAGDFYWDYRWTPNEVFRARGFDWYVDGGANSACRIDPKKCEEIYKHELATAAPLQGGGYTQSQFRSLAMETYRANPLKLLVDRTANFLRNWFGFGVRSSDLLLGQVLTLFAFLVVAFDSLTSLALKRPTKHGMIFLTLNACLLAPFLIMHIEYRYLEPSKMLGLLFLPITLHALNKVRRTENRPTANFSADSDI
jgi:hypothetical protein